MMTADSQKALVTTKAYDGVRKDRDEENILLMTFWKKILRERFARVLKYSSPKWGEKNPRTEVLRSIDFKRN